MVTLRNQGGGAIIRRIADVIVENRAWLSGIDGKIGDGDHGNNMAKGFGRAADRIVDDETLAQAMHTVADVLMGEIGGSMGPLYGMFFDDMASAIEGRETIDYAAFADMLTAGCEGVIAIGGAKRADKTLLDTLIPAIDAFREKKDDFSGALDAMQTAAEKGRDSTRDMVAKIGRASRLGERSKGVIDAGAASACLILTTLAIETRLRLE